ncbi:restriction endonuclease subunit S [Clostridium sp. J1101437_171009_A5]|uniref:restriction endonuclease subunit S n=1 Tax=Clostridium sp. J1101437_171009_A5 TaxID=2787098 RepID=UPI00189AF9E9|nr:restriction endonuclease subunit S [Clostridium sp. J1101437_171009_A5]
MGYETYRIADLIDEIAMGPFGSNIKVSCFVDSGVPVLNGSNLEGFSLSEKTFRYVTREKADSLNKANAHRGDIVITHRGTLGQIVFIPQDSKYDRYVISQSQFRVRCNDKVLPEYLVYYFHTPIGQHKLLSNASQVGVPALARPSSTFQQIEVVLPELSIQKRVVEIISTIQKKIVNNQEQNDNLADLLQTIYQGRFGNDILAVNQGVLSDICSYSTDKVAVSELNVRTYFSTENMLSGKAGSTEATSLPTTSQTTACHKGDTLISNIRPYFKKIVYCEDKCGCSTDVLCFTPSQPCYSAYLFSTLYADKFFAFMVAGSKGTKMPRGDKQQIMTYPVVLPSEEELAGFNTIASPLLEQIYSNRAENKRLSILRDTLLPKLMSGEINVSAIQL